MWLQHLLDQDMTCSTGITTVCDMGSIGEAEEVWEGLEQVYMPAADKGELPIRVFAMVPLTTWYSPPNNQQGIMLDRVILSIRCPVK